MYGLRYLPAAALLGFALAGAPDASAQGRSDNAPGWGRGGVSAGAGTTFETPFGRPSGGETKSHTTGGRSGGDWGRGGASAGAGATFETPSGPPSGGGIRSHTTGGISGGNGAGVGVSTGVGATLGGGARSR